MQLILIQFITTILAFITGHILYNLMNPYSEKNLMRKHSKINRTYAAMGFQSEIGTRINVIIFAQIAQDMNLGTTKSKAEYEAIVNKYHKMIPSFLQLLHVELPLTEKNFLPDELRDFLEIDGI